jgi:hypothetical protein
VTKATLVPAQVYEDALELLQQRGWCQGTGEDAAGHICLARALGIAAERYQQKHGWEHYEYSVLDNILDADDRPVIIAEHNDDPRTTFEDVALWLKQAAEQTRALPAA